MDLVIPSDVIASKILLIRNQKVLLDKDLALLYGVETRVLNQAVRRNSESFPEDFMFILTREEIMNISQFVIGSTIKHASNVLAFTEHGVLMLSSVLKSKHARMINIEIMRTFVALRHYLATHDEVKRKLDEHDGKINALIEIVNQLLEQPPENPKSRIGFYKEESL